MEASITVSHSFQCHPRAAQSARSASRGWHWKLWLTVMLASMMPTVVLLIASL
ncbi:IncQ-type mobilization protein MobB, partial [Escherichia coli]|uniref:IncQ-type mobilization protein MobB n=3 Tax=Gammaproteobacteria TaxID=1236 RepID=UPI0035B553EE